MSGTGLRASCGTSSNADRRTPRTSRYPIIQNSPTLAGAVRADATAGTPGARYFGFVQELFTPAAAGGKMEADASEAELAAMAETLPHLTAMVATEIHSATDPTLGWCDSQVEFEFTLDLLLDGLERLRDAR